MTRNGGVNMATTAATIIGFWQGFAILRRIKKAVDAWRNGKTIDPVDLQKIREGME